MTTNEPNVSEETAPIQDEEANEAGEPTGNLGTPVSRIGEVCATP
ncbi:hypothetical protein [Kitasatospora kifunensis]|uniref:Uncharacterized protein n=1 Tax=Kitasatospora kifunensis TaxID=58351 RepID=A0A7W7RAF9_KITKI|nr:hypothetical protein [Kitasatospora kifunensis]MBB4928412.1 hypothetical protein [Kitasatospora kifunensis]